MFVCLALVWFVDFVVFVVFELSVGIGVLLFVCDDAPRAVFLSIVSRPRHTSVTPAIQASCGFIVFELSLCGLLALLFVVLALLVRLIWGSNVFKSSGK